MRPRNLSSLYVGIPQLADYIQRLMSKGADLERVSVFLMSRGFMYQDIERAVKHLQESENGED